MLHTEESEQTSLSGFPYPVVFCLSFGAEDQTHGYAHPLPLSSITQPPPNILAIYFTVCAITCSHASTCLCNEVP
jgi:hypothetical protein